jgi:NAD(P) transhydrogenase
MDDLRRKIEDVTARELDVVHDQLERNGITVLSGEARFVEPHRVEVGDRVYESDFFLVGCGTRPARPNHIPFDGRTIFDSDEILAIDRIPRSMIVVGGGVIGIEYALMFAALGVDISVIDGRDRLLEFCDSEVVDALTYHARSLGTVFRLGEEVVRVASVGDRQALVELESGKRLTAEAVLFSVGREGDSERLRPATVGLQADCRGRFQTDENFRTDVPYIYAVGDVVGFPALASVSMEQGRCAASHAFDHPFEPCQLMPYGLFTIPEISMVGANEQELTAQRAPYEVGVARFREIARGQIVGDETGLLKLIFHRETRRLLGVHCIGETATEIVHIGQAVMALGGTIDYFRDTVFNYPTMAECYKVAAFDGLNKIDSLPAGLSADVLERPVDGPGVAAASAV